MMKAFRGFVWSAVALFSCSGVLAQQDIGTAFTYQGTLENGSGPVTDTCDFRFGLWDADAAGVQAGASPQTVALVDVVAGSFTVALDFGVGAINGDARWLEIEVQCPGDAGFVLLAPRVELTPAPHALRASTGVGPPAALEVDSVNGRIGIGTNAPVQPLHVVGTVMAQNPGTSPDGSTVRFGGPSGDPGLVIQRGDGVGGVARQWEAVIEHDSTLEIRDNTAGGLERLMIDTNGRVGIGTTTPDEQLTVAGAIRSTTGGFKFPDGTTQTTAATGGGVGSTLDGAYDQGGPGAGRVITADAGAVEIQGPDGLHVTGAIQSGNSITIDGAAHTVSSDADIEIHVADGRVMRFESDSTAPNVIAGHNSNAVSLGVVGASISGGRDNLVSAKYGTVGGGGPGNELIRYYCDTVNGVHCGRCSISNTNCNPSLPCPTGEECQLRQDICQNDHPSSICEESPERICLGGPDHGAPCGTCVGGSNPGGACFYEFSCGLGGSCVADPSACGSPGTCDAGVPGNKALADWATIAGGTGNTALGASSFVGGGKLNGATGTYSTVAGGWRNSAMFEASTVSGGINNAAMEYWSTIGGGFYNEATGNSSTVGGGYYNVAAENYSTVGGGAGNAAAAEYSTVPGGSSNYAGGAYSLAAGYWATVRDAATVGDSNGDNGTFVWADSTGTAFTSTGANQFLIRAGGGVGINTNDPDVDLEINGGTELSLTDGTGFLMLGDQDAVNLAFDTNEIQARNDAAAASLAVNPAGGNVGIGTTDADVVLELNGGNELSLTDSTGVLMLGDQDAVNIAFDTDEIQARNNAAAANLLLNPAGGDLTLASSSALTLVNGNLRVSTDTLFVDAASEFVGINTTTPTERLHVVGNIVYTGTITDISDERLKENIAPVADALEKILHLRGVYFNMTDTPDQRDVGLIAQDVQSVLPEAVSVVDPEKGYLGVAYPSVIPLLVEAIKEQDKAIGEKDCRIAELEARLERLEQMLGGPNGPNATNRK